MTPNILTSTHAQIDKALTPHEALSFMFTKMANKFDAKLLQVFIRYLGV